MDVAAAAAATVSSDRRIGTLVGVARGRVKAYVSSSMDNEKIAWSVKMWTAHIIELIQQDDENDSYNFDDFDDDGFISDEKEGKTLIKEHILNAAENHVSQSQTFSQDSSNAMETQTAEQDGGSSYSDNTFAYVSPSKIANSSTTKKNNSKEESSPQREQQIDVEPDEDDFEFPTATESFSESNSNIDALTQEEEIFGTLIDQPNDREGKEDDKDDKDAARHSMDIDSDEEGDRGDVDGEDSDSGESDGSQSEDFGEDDDKEEEDYRSGDEDNDVFGSFAKKHKKHKKGKKSSISKSSKKSTTDKNANSPSGSMSDHDDSNKKSSDTDDDDDSSPKTSKPKAEKKEREEKEKPKKKTALEEEMAVIKKLENGPSEADIKRQNAIEIDEDDMNDRKDNQRKLSLISMKQAAGIGVRQQLQKLRDCQLWLSKRYSESENTKESIVFNFEKVIRLMSRHGKDVDKDQVLEASLTLIEDLEEFNKFMEVEENLILNLDKENIQNSNSNPSLNFIKKETTPLEAVLSPSAANNKANAVVDMVYLSDSDESGSDIENSEEMAISRPSPTKQSAAAVMSRVQAPPLAPVNMTVNEKIKADMLNKRKLIEQKKLKQSLTSPIKLHANLSQSVVPKSRSDLYSYLQEKAHKDASDYIISRVKKIDASSSLSYVSELYEKCRQFHELWCQKHERDEERLRLEKKIKRTLEQNDDDDEEVEFGSDSKAANVPSVEFNKLTKEDLMKILEEQKEQAKQRRTLQTNSDSDSDSENDDVEEKECQDKEEADSANNKDEMQELSEPIQYNEDAAIAAATADGDDINSMVEGSKIEIGIDVPIGVQENLDIQNDVLSSSKSRAESHNDMATASAISTDKDVDNDDNNNNNTSNSSNQNNEENVSGIKTYGRRRSSLPSRIIDQDDDDVDVSTSKYSSEASGDAMHIDSVQVVESDGHVDNEDKVSKSDVGSFDLDAADTDGLDMMEGSSGSNKNSSSGATDSIDNAEEEEKEPDGGTSSSSSPKKKKDKKKDDGRMKNAAYRLMVMQEEEDVKRRQKLSKVAAGFLDDAAEEESDDEKGIQRGLGEFGFSVAKKNDEDNDGDIAMREDDFKNIVDDVSDDEGDEDAGRQKRFEMERLEDIKKTKIMIENVTTGFRSKSKNKTNFDDEKVLGSNFVESEKQQSAETEFDEEEYAQHMFAQKNQSQSQSRDDDDSDDESDESDDDDINQDGTTMTLEEEEKRNLAKLKKAERKRREKAEIKRFERTDRDRKALRSIARQNTMAGESQNSQIGSNITVIKAGGGFNSTSWEGVEGLSKVSSSSSLLETATNLKRRTSKIPVKINSFLGAGNSLARRQRLAPSSNIGGSSSSSSSISTLTRNSSMLGSNNGFRSDSANGSSSNSSSNSGSNSQYLSGGVGESSNSGMGLVRGLSRVNSIVTDGLISGISSSTTPRITPSSTTNNTNSLKRTNSFAADLMDSAMVRQFGGGASNKPAAVSAISATGNSNSGIDTSSKRPRLQAHSGGNSQHSMFASSNSNNDNSNSQHIDGVSPRSAISSNSNSSFGGGKENLGMQRSSSISNMNSNSNAAGEKKSMSSLFTKLGSSSSSNLGGTGMKRSGSTSALKK